ncbi:MAG TPA: hypothetical protein VH560_04805 [Polyangia bacterium]|jgi:hypothetical protein|nr:hypothetical protein [Polyangia bacterium]
MHMTLKVVVDAKDRIIAVAHLAANAGAGPALTARPVLAAGQREFDVEIPEAHRARHPRALFRSLHVEGGAVVYRGAVSG